MALDCNTHRRSQAGPNPDLWLQRLPQLLYQLLRHGRHRLHDHRQVGQPQDDGVLIGKVYGHLADEYAKQQARRLTFGAQADKTQPPGSERTPSTRIMKQHWRQNALNSSPNEHSTIYPRCLEFSLKHSPSTTASCSTNWGQLLTRTELDCLARKWAMLLRTL